MMDSMTLTTERLILREFNEKDWRAVHEYSSDPQVVRYMAWGPNIKAETQGFVRRIVASQQQEPRGKYEFAAILRSEDRLIGNCCLQVSNLSHREGWISPFSLTADTNLGWTFNYHPKLGSTTDKMSHSSFLWEISIIYVGRHTLPNQNYLSCTCRKVISLIWKNFYKVTNSQACV